MYFKKIISNILKNIRIFSILKKIQNILIAYNLEEIKPRFSNYPYLSGDSFFAISDIAYLQNYKNPIFVRKTKKPKVCFLEVSIFNGIKDINFLNNFKKIIIHNGDEIPNIKLISKLSKKNIDIFAVNILSKSKNVYPLPIGLENLYLRRNGTMHFYNPINIGNISSIKKYILLASFSNSTNPKIRNKLSNELIKYGYKNNFYSINNYRKKLVKSYFVISPPGNGFDCHRTWEALYFKTVPVVLEEYYGFSHLDLPVLKVDSFESFLSLTTQEKLEIYNKLIKKNLDSAYLDWWIKKIRS